MVEIGGAVVCLVGGAVFLLVSFGIRQGERDRRSRGVVVPGRVVGSRTVWTRNGSWYEAPVVEFRDSTGVVRQFQQPSGTSATPVPGTVVPVWHDPLRPEDPPVVHRDRVTRLMSVVFGVVGAGSLVVGSALLGGVLGPW
ncbi:MAG: DUF3592 domain-containing protein [Actinomycetes bacterium]